VIPGRWTLEEYARHTCDDRSHFHLSRTEYNENLALGLIEVVRAPECSRKGVMRVKAIVRTVRVLAARGLSCSMGEALPIMLSENGSRGVALVMMAEIRNRREIPNDDDGDDGGGAMLLEQMGAVA
jgi:hypothetical protein